MVSDLGNLGSGQRHILSSQAGFLSLLVTPHPSARLEATSLAPSPQQQAAGAVLSCSPGRKWVGGLRNSNGLPQLAGRLAGEAGTSNPTRVGASPVRPGPLDAHLPLWSPGLGCLTIPLKIHPALSTPLLGPIPMLFFRSLAMPCLGRQPLGWAVGPYLFRLSLYPRLTWPSPVAQW